MNEEQGNNQAAASCVKSTVDSLLNKLKPKLDKQINRYDNLRQSALDLSRSRNSAIGHPAALAIINLEWADDFIRRTYRLFAMMVDPDPLAALQSAPASDHRLAQAMLAVKVHSDACDNAISVAQMCLDIAEKNLRSAASAARAAGTTSLPESNRPEPLNPTDIIP